MSRWNRSEYSEKLRNPKWQKKRLEILEAAGWKCQACDAEDNTLAVHHLIYLSGHEPWDYPNDHLECLCEDCHSFREEFNEYWGRSLAATKFCDHMLNFIKPLFDGRCPMEERVFGKNGHLYPDMAIKALWKRINLIKNPPPVTEPEKTVSA